MPRQHVTIASTDDVQLEAVTFQHDVATQPFAILFVHQYSLLGGNMMLMMGMAQRLHNHGYNCITFNFRGVGGSTGKATLTGRAEIHDVLSVCDWIHEKLKQNIVVVGSSAGAPIAGSAVAGRPFIHRFIAIGYTFGRLCSLLFGSHFQAILSCPKPKLFIMGRHDGFTSPRQLSNRLHSARGDHNCMELIDNVGHFALEGPLHDEHISQLIHSFILAHADH